MLPRALTTIVCAATAVVLGMAAPSASAGVGTPAGYHLESSTTLEDGLEVLTMVGADPDQVVHVARLAPDAAFTLRAVASNDAVGGAGRERTSSMCVRYRCRIAVNADFAVPGSGEPIGGIVSFGQLLRSPVQTHHQLVAASDGRLSAGVLGWHGSLVSTDLRRLDLDGLNVPREADRLVLYTPAYGPATGTNPHGVEIVAEVVRPASPLRTGETALVRLVEIQDGAGDSAIGAGRAVLSGHGRSAHALRDLWTRIASGTAAPEVLLRIETDPPAAESVGGSPILVRDARGWFADASTDFVRGRHPRTVVGWTAAGEVLLVTIDGRQDGYSEGMTLAEAADLLIGLGAVEALNLDGGGSTTFVTDGEVRNRPSDRAVRRDGRRLIAPVPRRGEAVLGFVERPVAGALLIVPRSVAIVEPLRSLGPDDLQLPQALRLAVPAARDPASVPAGDLPALVAVETGDRGNRPLALAGAMLVAAVAAVGAYRRSLTTPAA